MKKLLAPLAAAAMLAFGGAAQAAFLDFQVNEGSVPGGPANVITADKINGAYTERLTINVGNTFTTNAYATFTTFLANEGQDEVEAALGVPNFISPAGYRMYALFTSAGNIVGSNFFGTSGSFSLYIDPNANTTLAVGATGADPIATGNTSDDYLIASSSVLAQGVGQVIPNIGGFFDLLFKDFTLTSGDQNALALGDQNGENYFISPRPFYLMTTVDGDFDEFEIVPGSITVTGDVSAVFIPEPGTLALAGLALAGLGFSARRRKA